MSIRRNIVANYASQIYVSVGSLVTLPFYLRYMGAEAYGLVGFFAMLNAWFALLDIGLTPTLAREVARYRGGALSAGTLRGLLRFLELCFFAVALLAAFSFVAGSDTIATRWLNAQDLSSQEVQTSIIFMGLIIPMRWMAGLYRGAVNGFERQTWLAGFNIAIGTARFYGIFAVFALFGTTPSLFFAYQTLVAAIELTVLARTVHVLMPIVDRSVTLHQAWNNVRSIASLSLAIALSGGIWIGITQFDKLLLSKLLPLRDYGYFSLAVSVATGVNLLAAPVTQALTPRLVKLFAESKETEALSLYRSATQIICVLTLPAALMLSCQSYNLLLAWTGDAEAATNAAPVLSLYAMGNALMVLSGMIYFLQFSIGKLRLHMAGMALMAVIYIPGATLGALQLGATGSGWAWIAATGLYFAAWVPFVHGRLKPGLHLPWLASDIAPIAISAGLATLAIVQLTPFPEEGRIAYALAFVASGFFVLGVASTASSVLRKAILARLKRPQNRATAA